MIARTGRRRTGERTTEAESFELGCLTPWKTATWTWGESTMLGAMQGLATPPGEAGTKEGNREGRCERERVRERARELGGERWIDGREGRGERVLAAEGERWDRGMRGSGEAALGLARGVGLGRPAQ